MSNLLGMLLRVLASWSGIEPAPRPRPTPRPTPDPVPPTPTGPGVVEAINAARASAGLDPLAPDPALQDSAATWARVMAGGGGLSHGDFAGRIGAIFPRTAAGEDVAEGQPTPDAVVAAWMSSPPHRANILGPFNKVGAGSALDAAGSLFWCVDFVGAG